MQELETQWQIRSMGKSALDQRTGPACIHSQTVCFLVSALEVAQQGTVKLRYNDTLQTKENCRYRGVFSPNLPCGRHFLWIGILRSTHKKTASLTLS